MAIQEMFLIIMDIALFGLISILIIPYISPLLDKRIEFIRDFIVKNESFFSILFLSLFVLGQIFLITIAYDFETNTRMLKFSVSIFSLYVISIASIQKIVLDVQKKYFKTQINYAGNALTELRVRYIELNKRYKELKKLKNIKN